MTWLTTWPTGTANVPQYAAHDTERAARAHAAEIVRSHRAAVATVFWTETEEIAG